MDVGDQPVSAIQKSTAGEITLGALPAFPQPRVFSQTRTASPPRIYFSITYALAPPLHSHWGEEDEEMLKTEEQLRRLAALTSVVIISAAEALAQENRTQSTRRIVISIPDRSLAVIESGRVLKVYPTAVGASITPTPTGSYRIIQRIPNPTWYTKGRVVPPGKSNPLGTRWLGLSVKGYGIHGTNNPSSIGHNASHGCIRMRNQDIEELFELVSIGDRVELYRERTAELESIFGAAEAVGDGVAAGQ